MRPNRDFLINACMITVFGLISILLFIWVLTPRWYLALCALLGVAYAGAYALAHRASQLRGRRILRRMIPLAGFLFGLDVLNWLYLSAASVPTFGSVPASWGIGLAEFQGFAVSMLAGGILMSIRGSKFFQLPNTP